MSRGGFTIGPILAAACFVATPAGEPADDFAKSLHATRSGKNHWYGAANGGFEKWTGVGMDELGCTGCHGPADADGNPYADGYPGPSCADCHRSQERAVADAQCYGCHGRQATEAKKLKLPDVHREAGMSCTDCHGADELHGDGTSYVSMLQPGAIKADCAGCHAASDLPAGHADHDPHEGKLHCSACHTASVVTCYNCHFESQVRAHVKRAHKPLSGVVMLVNREEDGKFHTATFQSLTYEGKAFVAYAPFGAHTTVKKGRACTECHVGAPVGGENEAIRQYNESGVIRFTSWNEESGSLDWIRGVVPLPEDYAKTVQMAFLDFEGDLSLPPGRGAWSPLDQKTPDGTQMLFASPLTREQMEKLGFAARKAETVRPCNGSTQQ